MFITNMFIDNRASRGESTWINPPPTHHLITVDLTPLACLFPPQWPLAPNFKIFLGSCIHCLLPFRHVNGLKFGSREACWGLPLFAAAPAKTWDLETKLWSRCFLLFSNNLKKNVYPFADPDAECAPLFLLRQSHWYISYLTFVSCKSQCISLYPCLLFVFQVGVLTKDWWAVAVTDLSTCQI